MSATETPPAADVLEIAGTVTRLFYQKPTFSAGEMDLRGRPVKFAVKGYVTTGPVTLRGSWQDSKYGRQFAASEVVYVLPTNPDGLAAWLQWYGDQLGPVKSQRLIDEFGMSLMARVCDDPQQVAAVAGIPIECVNRLAVKWTEHSGRVAAATQFAAWGCTQAQTEAILGRFGGSAVGLVRDDPYAVLGRVDGFGWTRTDELAAKVGCTGDDPRRLRGAVLAVVREKYDAGSTVVPLDVACLMAADKIGRSDQPTADKVAAVIGAAVEGGLLRKIGGVEGAAGWLATRGAYEHEAEIWQTLKISRKANPHTKAEEGCVDFRLMNLADKYRSFTVNGHAVELDDEQRNAVYAAAKYRISVVTGGAGSGKSTVARAITKFFDDADVPVMLAAPTGKAARRLEEVIGKTASTIHRLLEYSGHDGGFAHNKDNPLPECVVILDELSMCDAALLYHVLVALGPKTVLVMLGDPNQLPPVGPGAPFRDILAHNLAPTTRLQTCHRQAGTLKRNCNAILRGEVAPWASDEEPSPWVVSRKCADAARTIAVVSEMYSKWLRQWGYDPVTQTQFMVAKHDGPLGTKRLNLILQRLHQAALGNALDPVGDDDHERRAVLYVGDKVIQTKNNYEKEVMNGEIGIVRETGVILVVDYGDKTVAYAKKEEAEVSLAYCLSVHKMQGSEIDCAVLIVPKAHGFMQHRSWAYTGVTRAKKTAVIIGDDEGIRRAAERVDTDKRETLLQVFAGNEGVRPC